MALNQNQFALEPIQGMPDLLPGNVVSAQVASSQATALVAGQPVKLITTGNTIPQVVSLAANTDKAWGFVVYNLKDQDYPAYARAEIALAGSVIYLTAGAAIARGASVEVIASTSKVITNAGINPIAGYALDEAAADGDLIRVYILGPYVNPTTTDATIQGFTNTVTLAEVNAGKTIAAVPTGKKAVVTNFTARSNGAFAALTSVNLKVGSAVVASLAQAQLTNGAVLVPASSGVTLGAAFGVAGADGADIVVDKTGSAGTTATDIAFTVSYYLIDA